jgi:ubiquitin thioesterase protein OTUB1
MTDKAPAPEESSSHATKVQQTQAQLEAIEQDIKDNQALTSQLRDLDSLRHQYDTSTGEQEDDIFADASKYFLLGIQALQKKYSKLRTIRGDGNCYYRAFLYSLCEKLLSDKTELDRIVKLGTYIRCFSSVNYITVG